MTFGFLELLPKLVRGLNGDAELLPPLYFFLIPEDFGSAPTLMNNQSNMTARSRKCFAAPILQTGRGRND